MKWLIKSFLNQYSRLIAWVQEGVDEEEMTPALLQQREAWLKTCREHDALDGVVEIRKAVGDVPEDV